MLQLLGNGRASGKLNAGLSSTKVYSIILAMGIVSVFGCDPVRTIRQNVVIAVVDEQGLPTPNVKVSMKESWDSFQSWGGGTPESEKSYIRQRWASEIPWLEGVSNAQGQAVIEIKKTGLDGTRGREPPPNRDTVSNREYLIKLQSQTLQEELCLVMKPGAAVKGKSYTVTVIDVQKPRYVPTSGEERKSAGGSF